MLIKGFLASYGDATHFFASFPTFDILESLCGGRVGGRGSACRPPTADPTTPLVTEGCYSEVDPNHILSKKNMQKIQKKFLTPWRPSRALQGTPISQLRGQNLKIASVAQNIIL